MSTSLIKPGDRIRCKLRKHIPVDFISMGFSENQEHVVLATRIEQSSGLQVIVTSSLDELYAHEVIVVAPAPRTPTLAEKNKETLTQILNDEFGEENWEFTTRNMIQGFGSHNSCILIRFKDIEIRNSYGRKHPIKDLFVIVLMGSDYRLVDPEIYGTRTSRTKGEHSLGYSHSHLSRGGDIRSVSRFCTGGDAVYRIANEIVSDNLHPSNDTFFKHELYFSTLNAFVRWESLEGGPYVKFGDINNSSNASLSSPRSCNLTEINNFIKDTKFNIPFSVDFQEKNGLIFKISSSFEEELYNHFVTNVDIIPQRSLADIFVVENSIGKQYALGSNSSVTKEVVKEYLADEDHQQEYISTALGTSHVTFKGVNIPNVIIQSNKNKGKLKINNLLIQNLKMYYKQKFYGKYFNEEGDFITQITGSSSTV